MIWRKRAALAEKSSEHPAAPARNAVGPGGLAAVADVLGSGLLFAASSAGTAVTFVMGKLAVAAVLALIALGVALRFLHRRKTLARPAPVLSMRARIAAAVGALIGVTMLVEAVRLPVRFDQPGFAPVHWLYVIVATLVVHWLLLLGLRRLAARKLSSSTGIRVNHAQHD